MNFIRELPERNDYNAILLITDRFTKMQHYIPTERSQTSKDMANAYLYDIWRLYGLSQHITYDREPQFALACSWAFNDVESDGMLH